MLIQARALGPNDHVIGSFCCDLARPPFRRKSVDIIDHLADLPSPAKLGRPPHGAWQAARVARKYLIMSYYDRACLTYWTQMTRPEHASAPARSSAEPSGPAICSTWPASIGLTPVEIHHYRRFISLNSAVCFRTRH